MSDEEPKDRLKQARMDAGLTRQQLAERIDRSLSTVRANENGQNSITTEAAAAYAQALDVTPTWILFGYDTGPGRSAEFVSKWSFLPVLGELIHGTWRDDPNYGTTHWGATYRIPDTMFDPQCRIHVCSGNFEGYILGDYVVVSSEKRETIIVGDHIVVRRRKSGFSELSLWRVAPMHKGLVAVPLSLAVKPYDHQIALPNYGDEEAELIGVVVGRLGLFRIGTRSHY